MRLQKGNHKATNARDVGGHYSTIDSCPANNATCRCGKLGHYASECRTKSVQEISTEDTSDNELYLGAVQQADSENDLWKVELYIKDVSRD